MILNNIRVQRVIDIDESGYARFGISSGTYAFRLGAESGSFVIRNVTSSPYSSTGTAALTISAANAATFSGAVTVSGTLTYGGVTLSNAVTGTGAMVLANSPTLTTPNIGAATATSVTGPTSTDLTLSGGSSGASLVLGQGASGVTTFSAPASGYFKFVGESTTALQLIGTSTTNSIISANSTLTGAKILNIQGSVVITTIGGFGEASRMTSTGNLLIGTTTDATSGARLQVQLTGTDGTVSTLLSLRKNQNGAGTGVAIDFAPESTDNPLAKLSAVRTNLVNGYTDFRFSTWNGSALSEQVRLVGQTGNLLIGTTTDASSLSGGLVVNGSGAGATASSTTTGALRVTGGVGVSGAIYAQNINVTAGNSNSTNAFTSGNDANFVRFTLGRASAGQVTFGVSASANQFITGDAAGDLVVRTGTIGTSNILFSTDGGATNGMKLSSANALTVAGNLTVSGTGDQTFSTTGGSLKMTSLGADKGIFLTASGGNSVIEAYRDGGNDYGRVVIKNAGVAKIDLKGSDGSATLAGTLTGTSATFTSTSGSALTLANVTAGQNAQATLTNSQSGQYSILRMINSGGTAASYDIAVAGSAAGTNPGGLYIYDNTAGFSVLKFAPTTGNATFAGTLTVSGNSIAGASSLTLSGGAGDIALSTSGIIQVPNGAPIRSAQTNNTGTMYIDVASLEFRDPSASYTTRAKVASSGLIVYPTTASTSTTTGALVVSGGAGFAGEIFGGGSLHIADSNAVFWNAYYSAGDKYSANGYAAKNQFTSGIMKWSLAPNNVSGVGAALTYTDVMTLQGTTLSSGVASLLYSTASTSTTTGALVVSGGAGIAGNAFIGGRTATTLTSNTSIPHNTATTIATHSVSTVVIYSVVLDVNSNAGFAIIGQGSAGSPQILSQGGSQMTFSISGQNVQLTQTSGSASTTNTITSLRIL